LATQPTSSGAALDQITQLLSQFVADVVELETLAKKLGTARDSSEVRRELKEKRNLATGQAKSISQLFQRIKSIDDTRRHSRLLDQFNDGMKRLTAVSKSSIDKERTSPLPETDIESGRKEERPSQQKQIQHPGVLKGLEGSTVDVDRAIIEETNQQFRHLEGELEGLVDTQKEIQEMLGEQKELLNEVEVKVEVSDKHVEGGVDELEKAAEYQSKARKLYVVLCLIVLCILLGGGGILALILGLKFK